MNNIVIALVIAIAGIIGGLVISRNKSQKSGLQSLEDSKQKVAEADKIREEALREAETVKREALLQAKDDAYKLREEIEAENREKRAETQRLERRLAQKEEALERRMESVDTRERSLQHKEAELTVKDLELAAAADQKRDELQRISGMSVEEAKGLFLKTVEDESRRDAAKLMREIEEEAKRDGERKARNIITQAIQRCAVDQTSETTVSVVPLPNDEMKGRIIGREGRNIRAFETMTGVDLIIDDTPEAVVLSAFDPVRREIARISLTNLIIDGRIHPGRIEEMIEKAREEVDARIIEAGEQAIMDTGMTGVAPDVVKLLGKMKYRTSFGQNVLAHSVEVSYLCGLLAMEVGADINICKRAGLFHDLGKAVDHEVEGPHAVIGADILRRYRESPEVILAVEGHHYDVEPSTVEAILVICADSISAARPGARRETLETYVKRLKKLEEIAESYPGVDRTFAVQAGREIRMIVRPEMIDDLAAIKLARDTARRIEDEMEYPGQIKVTVIRETRASDFAK
ncbi:MAG: ribonuclease Y [Chthonomonadales bacterium]